jgi:hypothetical protein
MSEQVTASAPAAQSPNAAKTHSAEEVEKVLRFHAFWKFALVIGIIMVGLAMLGVALTMTTNPSFARTYWIALVPVFGLLCIGTAYKHGRKGDQPDRSMIWRQLAHWLGIGLAIGFDFFISGTGEETRIASGLNALLLLALGCYLAGVHLEWIFALVGAMLTLIVVLVAKFEQYEWLVFIVGGLVVAGMCAWWWLIGASARRHQTALAASKPASVSH